MSEDLKAGDTLFLVPGINYAKRMNARHALIYKVGRKWLTLESTLGRVDRKTLAYDSGGYAPAWIVYRSEDDYRKDKRRGDLRRAIANKMGSWSGTADLTNEQLEGIAKIIGIE